VGFSYALEPNNHDAASKEFYDSNEEEVMVAGWGALLASAHWPEANIIHATAF
jgi:hypothetical protein